MLSFAFGDEMVIMIMMMLSMVMMCISLSFYDSLIAVRCMGVGLGLGSINSPGSGLGWVDNMDNSASACRYIQTFLVCD